MYCLVYIQWGLREKGINKSSIRRLQKPKQIALSESIPSREPYHCVYNTNFPGRSIQGWRQDTFPCTERKTVIAALQDEMNAHRCDDKGRTRLRRLFLKAQMVFPKSK